MYENIPNRNVISVNSLEHFLTKIRKSYGPQNDPRDMSAAKKWWDKEYYVLLDQIVRMRIILQPWMEMEISTPLELESQLPSNHHSLLFCRV